MYYKTLMHNMDVGCGLELFAASTMTPQRHSALAPGLTYIFQNSTMPSATLQGDVTDISNLFYLSAYPSDGAQGA
jgi:hypothetical protein